MSQRDETAAETLLDALRADVPSAGERERVRARLLAAGVLTAPAVPPAANPSTLGWGPKLTAATGHAKLALVSVTSAGALAMAALNWTPHATPQLERARTRDGRVVRARGPAESPAAATADVATGSQSTSADALPASPNPVPAEHGALASERVRGASTTVGKAPNQPRRRAALQLPRSQTVSNVPALAGTPEASPRRSDEPAAAPAVERQPESHADVADQVAQGPNDAAVSSASSSGALATDRAGLQPTATAAQSETATRVGFAAPVPEPTRPQPGRRHAASELAQETKLMERALAALRVGDLPAARAWLNVHAQHFPDGLLRLDRMRVSERIHQLTRHR